VAISASVTSVLPTKVSRSLSIELASLRQFEENLTLVMSLKEFNVKNMVQNRVPVQRQETNNIRKYCVVALIAQPCEIKRRHHRRREKNLLDKFFIMKVVSKIH
jgi:hypothetical protein